MAVVVIKGSRLMKDHTYHDFGDRATISHEGISEFIDFIKRDKKEYPLTTIRFLSFYDKDEVLNECYINSDILAYDELSQNEKLKLISKSGSLNFNNYLYAKNRETGQFCILSKEGNLNSNGEFHKKVFLDVNYN